MLRLCLFGNASAVKGCQRTATAVTATTKTVSAATLQLSNDRRTYATAQQSTRSSAKERRYYTDPLRAPQYGVSTTVGRQKYETGRTGAYVNPAAHANTTTRCVTVLPEPKTQLMRTLAAYGHAVRYNTAGVPVEGSWFLLPWREQLRILAAILAAFCITKAFFDVTRFELLYYGVWKLGYRNDNSFTKRVLYYGSTAMLAAGLFFSFNVNFFLSAWVVGRRELAAHMVHDVFTLLMPRRTLQLLERRVGLTLI